MKIFIISSFIASSIFASVFNYDIVDTFLVKNNCSKVEINDGFFKLNSCLEKSDGILIEELECIYSKKVICSSGSKNFMLDGKFQVVNNHIYINSGFLNLMEIKYSVK